MKILIVGKLADTYQTDRLTQEAEKIGASVDIIKATQLSTYYDENGFSYKITGTNIRLEDYDVIYLLIVGKRGWDWYFTLSTLMQKHNIKVVNEKFVDPKYKIYYTAGVEFLLQAENNIPFPKTSIFFNYKSGLEQIKNYNFPVILKVISNKLAKKGRGVHLINSTKQLKEVVDKHKDVASHFILREYIENDGDYRIFTVGYKAIGVMKRNPKDGEFRSNISQGGFGEGVDSQKVQNLIVIAEKISKLYRTEIAGVDIIVDKNTNKPYLLEINRGPQFVGLEKYTKVNAAKKIIEYFVSLVE